LVIAFLVVMIDVGDDCAAKLLFAQQDEATQTLPLDRQHEPLGVVFDALRERGLYFVDSMTSDASAARPLASERKLRFAPRDLFIDDAEDRSRAAINLKRLLATGNSENGLLLIGHPYPETVTALEEMVPRFRSKGFEIVPLSVMVGRKQGTRQDESLKNSGPDGNGSRKRTP
jgi:polysaccharide deacetylase 2 family uncharacterized protein YibQ